MTRRCYVCGKPYFRRNLSIKWTFNGRRWTPITVKNHPECDKLFRRWEGRRPSLRLVAAATR